MCTLSNKLTTTVEGCFVGAITLTPQMESDTCWITYREWRRSSMWSLRSVRGPSALCFWGDSRAELTCSLL